jgi:FlaA1/EpsC-like NDP-sugar epimerase
MKYPCIAVLGATGFLGQALIPFLLKEYNPKVIRLLGRSEFKLAQIIRGNGYKYDLNKFRPLICDIRDRERVFSCLKDVDLIIHTAALKRLEIINYNPQEGVKTNVIGSMNVMDACINLGVQKAVFISSDKAVNATNLYGKTKAVMESMVIERAKMVGNGTPKMCIVRYGNVIGSTGAVIPFFISLARQGKPLPVTNLLMTRFLMTKKHALELIKTAIDKGGQGKVIIPQSIKSISVGNMVGYINRYFHSDAGMQSIGEWSGEKLHEEIVPEWSSFDADRVTYEEFIEMLKEEELI